MAKHNGRTTRGEPLQYARDVLVKAFIKEISVFANVATCLHKYAQGHWPVRVIKYIRFAGLYKRCELTQISKGSGYCNNSHVGHEGIGLCLLEASSVVDKEGRINRRLMNHLTKKFIKITHLDDAIS